MEEKVPCRTPTKGRDGVTNLPRWKFDLIREAIHAVLQDGDIGFRDLTDAVRPRIPADRLAEIGSLGWHVTSVKLELEVRGEIARVAGKSPQVLTRTT